MYLPIHLQSEKLRVTLRSHITGGVGAVFADVLSLWCVVLNLLPTIEMGTANATPVLEATNA